MNFARRLLATLMVLSALMVLPPTSGAAAPRLPVPFLPTPPEIDGIPDAPVAALPAAPFAEVKPVGTPGPIAPVTYQLAYGTTFLYLYLEVADDRPVHRDRGYQNGDGFHLVLALPKPVGQASEEFYVLGFAGGSKPGDFFRQFVWYHDIELAFAPLPDSVRVAQYSGEGRTGYELLLPWSAVPPYHPWFSPLGFNLCFVKAAGDAGKVTHTIVADSRIRSEQSRRLYAELDFQTPTLTEGQQTFLLPDRNHCRVGETVTATQATLAAAAMDVPTSVRLLTGDGAEVQQRSEFPVQKGLNRRQLALPTATLPAEGIRLLWSAGDLAGSNESALSILPPVTPDELRARLEAAAPHLAPGSRTTLEFRLERLRSRLEALRPRQSCGALRLELAGFLRQLEQAERGIDPVAGQRGLLRRAFRSRLDATLQPYSVKLPTGFDPARRYALVVFLHGSGQDDLGTLNALPDLPGVLWMAPRARGTSHWYVADHAQEDVAEALADMQAHYPVDSRQIYLAGFSMGGYGVYRTFWQSPQVFRGLIVLAGLPRIPGRNRPDDIDFTLDQNLALFRGVPMFIAHGTADLNCAFALTERVVGQLRHHGAIVEFQVEPGVGHDITPAMRRGLAAWLTRQQEPAVPRS